MESAITPFDWHRMFLGDVPPLFLAEVAFRTLFMYGFALLAARVIGKRGMSNLTPFEWIIVIILGTAAGDPTLSPNVPLLHGMVVIVVVILLDRGMAIAMRKAPRLESLVNTDPALVVQNGQILEDVLDREHLSDDEFFMALRTQGLRATGDIEHAYLEPSGQVSVFLYPRGKGQAAGTSTSTLPAQNE